GKAGSELASVLQLRLLVPVAKLGVSRGHAKRQTWSGDAEARTKTFSEIPNEVRDRYRYEEPRGKRDRLAGGREPRNHRSDMDPSLRSGFQKEHSYPCLCGENDVW